MSDPVLVITVQRRSLEITNLLLQAGADVNAYGSDGMTAMMWAAQQDEPEILKVLIAANGDKTLTNTHGETALVIAQRFQHNEIERLLTENRMRP
jgi:ankyrin repeat protein